MEENGGTETLVISVLTVVSGVPAVLERWRVFKERRVTAEVLGETWACVAGVLVRDLDGGPGSVDS